MADSRTAPNRWQSRVRDAPAASTRIPPTSAAGHFVVVGRSVTTDAATLERDLAVLVLTDPPSARRSCSRGNTSLDSCWFLLALDCAQDRRTGSPAVKPVDPVPAAVAHSRAEGARSRFRRRSTAGSPTSPRSQAGLREARAVGVRRSSATAALRPPRRRRTSFVGALADLRGQRGSTAASVLEIRRYSPVSE